MNTRLSFSQFQWVGKRDPFDSKIVTAYYFQDWRTNYTTVAGTTTTEHHEWHTLACLPGRFAAISTFHPHKKPNQRIDPMTRSALSLLCSSRVPLVRSSSWVIRIGVARVS